MKIEDLIKKNRNKLSQTDLLISEFILKNKNGLDLSINDLAKLCFTSRTSVLRFAKKLGFKGYSELKFFVNKDRREDLKDKSFLKKDLDHIYKILDRSHNIFIYGNGQYEEVLMNAIKLYFKDLGRLSETYQGRDEITTFNQNSLKNATIIIIDLYKDEYALELLSIIYNVDCLKILISNKIKNSFLCDYFINIGNFTKEDFKHISKRLSIIEEFFEGYQLYRKAL